MRYVSFIIKLLLYCIVLVMPFKCEVASFSLDHSVLCV